MVTDEAKIREDVLKFFLRRLTLLTIRYDHGPGTSERATAISSFPVLIEGVCFLVTAGHILERIDAVLAAGGRVLQAQIFDGWWDESSRGSPIPINYSDAHRFFIHDKGVDVGVIYLEPLIARNVVSGGVVPFTDELWTNPPGDASFLAIVGLPQELEEIIPDTKGNILGLAVSPAVVILDPCEPPAVMTTEFIRVYGKLREPLVDASGKMLQSVDGLSGSPCIGFRIEGEQLRYWLIGVQSAWNERLRVLAISLFEPFAGALTSEILAAQLGASEEADE